VTARDQLGDEGDDLRNGLGCLRQLVGKAEPEVADVLEIPLCGLSGELCAGAVARRLVDLVVDVRDVVDERHVVAA
jgi:hypothetical protein